MCNADPLRNWLIAIAAAIAVAIGAIVFAAVTNGSFWNIHLSPIAMFVATGATGLGVFFCGQALDALSLLSSCTRERCAGQSNNVRYVLEGARVVLGIQATACLSVALYAWIPIAPQPAMWVIIGALAVQLFLIISAIAFFDSLASCATSAG